MKKTTIILLVIANILFWWGFIGLVGNNEFEALTHNENIVFFCCIMVAGLFLVVSAMQSYAYAIAAKERDRAQNIVNVYRERYDELSNLYNETELNLQSCKYQLNKFKALQAEDQAEIDKLELQVNSWKMNFIKKRNELDRLKELNKKHFDELNQLRISNSILKSQIKEHPKQLEEYVYGKVYFNGDEFMYNNLNIIVHKSKTGLCFDENLKHCIFFDDKCGQMECTKNENRDYPIIFLEQ